MADFYIDFTAAGGGNGTFATPWNDYSQITGVTTSDVVWVRRVSKTITTSASGFGPAWPDNVPVVGWPIAGDTRYSTRPTPPRTAWDADSAQYAEVLHIPSVAPASTNGVDLVTLSPGNNLAKTWRMSRLRFYRRGFASGNTTGVLGSGVATGSGTVSHTYITENCSFEADASNVPSGFAAVVGFFRAASTNAAAHSWTDAESVLIATSGTTGAGQGLYFYGSGSAGSYQGLAASWRNTSVKLQGSHASARWFVAEGPSALLSGTMDSCTFEALGVVIANLAAEKFSSAPGLLFHRCTFRTAAGSSSGLNRFSLWNRRYNECIFQGFNSVDVNDPGCSVSLFGFRPGGTDAGQATLLVSAGSALVRAANAFFSPGAARDIEATPASDGIAGGHILLRTVIESGSGLAARQNTIVDSSDFVGSPGYRIRRTLAGTAQTVSVSRVGGARYSFLLTPSSGPAAQALGIGTSEPGFDSVFVALKPGANTITMYGSHVGYAVAPTTEDVWLDVEVPTASGRVTTSGRAVPFAGAALSADTSTWNGIAGGSTRFAVSVSVTSSIPVTALVRGFCDLYGGSVYLDPSVAVS